MINITQKIPLLFISIVFLKIIVIVDVYIVTAVAVAVVIYSIKMNILEVLKCHLRSRVLLSVSRMLSQSTIVSLRSRDECVQSVRERRLYPP